MAPGILNYFGFGAGKSAQEPKTTVRALPSNWYTSPAMYELERRAIFSKKWMLITHEARLTQPGDWLRFDIVGFAFVLCRDRQGTINGFHNVCRHRAYPVVVGDQGCAKIFSCKYHGWSYGLNGKLAKAPGFQDMEGFDRNQNNLMPIHVHVDRNGFIWVNLDAAEQPEVTWEEELAGTDTQARYKDFHFEDYVFDHVWQMDGHYNWKLLAENYGDCYHCQTTHPDIPSVADLEHYSVDFDGVQMMHDPGTTVEQREKGLTVAPTYYFPNASTNITPHFFMVQRFVPTGPTSSSMQYQVFRNKNSSEEDFQLVNQMYKRIMSEDKVMCHRAQKNIDAGVFINGELHPRLEKGPLYFQKLVREMVTAHHELEQTAKMEIWPAQARLPQSAKVSQKDVDFCSRLECAASQEGLAW